MKIQGSFDPFQIFAKNKGNTPTKTERDGGGGGRNEYDPNQTKKEQNSDGGAGNSEDQSKKLSQALDAFQADTENQASGLTAKVEGTGPGLRISVCDVNGNRLRQFSSEEFLRLRESSNQDVRHRGKILDQKL